MPTLVSDLELPTLNIMGLARAEAVAVATALAEETWIAKSELGYAILSYDEGVSALRERRFFNGIRLIRELNGLDPDSPVAGPPRRESILSMEGDAHTRLRRLVSPAFTPGAVDSHRPMMRTLIADLIRPHLSAGRLELVTDVCEPYPIPIICEVLGAPASDWAQFSDWATDIFKVFNQKMHTKALETMETEAALRRALEPAYPNLREMKLMDFKVRVLSGAVRNIGGTASFVRVLIESGDRRDRWTTVGVSHNIIEASWQALVDSINYKLFKDDPQKWPNQGDED